MKIIVLIFTVIFGTGIIFAQDNQKLNKKEQRRLIKEQENMIAEKQKVEWEILVQEMIQKNEFVIEADILYDRHGKSNYVNPPMNYILVDSIYSVIMAESQRYLGRSGLGGEIVEGRIINYKKEKNENRNSYQIDYTLESPLGAYNVSISLSASGKADAMVRGEFSGSRVRYSGNLVRIDDYKVYMDRVF